MDGTMKGLPRMHEDEHNEHEKVHNSQNNVNKRHTRQSGQSNTKHVRHKGPPHSINDIYRKKVLIYTFDEFRGGGGCALGSTPASLSRG